MRTRKCFLLFFLLLNCTHPTDKAGSKLTPFEQDEKWGYKNESGQVAIKPRFTLANDFSVEGIAAVLDDTGWAYINTKGKIIIRPFSFDNGPDYFREGLARFARDGKFGFFDKAGKVVIKPRFDFATPFQEGLAAICQGCKEKLVGEHGFMEGGNWGYINQQGETVIPLQFEEARSFINGQAEVKHDGKWIRIDKTGTVIP
jgi:hypothetical protein